MTNEVLRQPTSLHELIKFPSDFSAEEPQQVCGVLAHSLTHTYTPMTQPIVWHLQKAVAFNDDGSLLATGGKDGVVRVWKVKRASGDADKATRVSSVTVTL